MYKVTFKFTYKFFVFQTFFVHCLITNECECFFLKGISLRKVLLQNYLFNKKTMKADLAELGAGGLLH